MRTAIFFVEVISVVQHHEHNHVPINLKLYLSIKFSIGLLDYYGVIGVISMLKLSKVSRSLGLNPQTLYEMRFIRLLLLVIF